MHSPDGKRRGGADAASMGGPLVMQVVMHKGDHMNRIAKIIYLLVMVTLPVASLAQGWTDYGKITELNQQPNTDSVDVYIIADLPNNPTSCPMNCINH